MGSMETKRPARIGNAMGAVTDLAENMAVLAARKDIDFIVGDWMSEYNMASRGSLKATSLSSPPGDPTEAAFEINFLESIEPCLKDIAQNGIKVAVNAGCSDTEQLFKELTDLIARHDVRLNVAWVEGDEVYDAVNKCRGEGQKFRNITTGM
jgi:hypothetical protein